MKPEKTDYAMALVEIIEVITKHQLTLDNYESLKKDLDNAVGRRIIGNKKP